jgi:transcriptional regulator with XRE-family HTH domain
LNALESKIKLQLAKRIYDMRKARKYTQEELAARAGISVSYLSLIERAKRIPHVVTLALIAAALGTTLSEIFRDVG